MESFVLIPVVLAYSKLLASSMADDTVVNTPVSLSLIYNSQDEDQSIIMVDDKTDAYCEDDVNSIGDAGDSHGSGCADGVYLFKEWTSSTGLLFSVLLLYIGLVTITNIVVLYKFIATWNQITVSLREQNRVCAKYANLPSTRRQTCQEALKPSRYNGLGCVTSTAATCPICLLDIQNQDFVSCDGGCGTTFHKNCIYNWLEFKGNTDSLASENHTSCPCCRKEMIGTVVTDSNTTTSASGFISELSTLVGYYPY
jgi:Ring finger domain